MGEEILHDIILHLFVKLFPKKYFPDKQNIFPGHGKMPTCLWKGNRTKQQNVQDGKIFAIILNNLMSQIFL